MSFTSKDPAIGNILAAGEVTFSVLVCMCCDGPIKSFLPLTLLMMSAVRSNRMCAQTNSSSAVPSHSKTAPVGPNK